MFLVIEQVGGQPCAWLLQTAHTRPEQSGVELDDTGSLGVSFRGSSLGWERLGSVEEQRLQVGLGSHGKAHVQGRDQPKGQQGSEWSLHGSVRVVELRFWFSEMLSLRSYSICLAGIAGRPD
jgi:hypothetical protein